MKYQVLTAGFLALSCVPALAQSTLVTPVVGNAAVSSTNPLPTASQALPSGATPITAVGTGTTGAVSATLAASATAKTYICGVIVSAIGGTATIGPITITNLLGNTFTLQLASSAGGSFFSQAFTPCIPTTGVNTSIVVATTADATATAVDVNAWGYTQ